MNTLETNDSETVLVCAANRREGDLTCELLQRDGLNGKVCPTINAVCEAIAEGAGAALVTEEMLAGQYPRLKQFLDTQPPWSDFPFVVFGSAGQSSRLGAKSPLLELGKVTLLDRPVRVRSMLAAVHASLRGRRRQYEARRAIESRDQFLAMLGHELRNPLGAIRLAGDLMGADGSEEQKEKHLSVIARQTQHLSRLVDDLLDVARVTHGKINLKRRAFDVCEVVRACHHSLMGQARDRSLSYDLSCPDTELRVFGDRVRMEQVFNNLITNALKYTPAGGSVRVSVEREGTAAVVRVKDSGIGISKEMLPRVFDLFAQADDGVYRSSGGMGLGLTLVRQLVHLHGGSVLSESGGLGKGSVFGVSLPLCLEANTGDADEENSKSVGDRRLRVVVVDDDDDIRMLQQELLELEGHQVVTAYDGPSGFDTILTENPDIALVDLGLPGFDGFEVARRVRAQCGSQIQLIAVSGYGRPQDRVLSSDAGFNEHLTKPIGTLELRAVMRKHCD